MDNRRRKFGRPVAWMAVGLMVGIILTGPAGAHIGTTISHLWGAPNHLKRKVQTFGDGRWARKSHSHDTRYHRFGGTLPPGMSMTGSWIANGAIPDDPYISGVISFPVPLGFNPTAFNAGLEETAEECPGSVDAPTAAPGYLCLYLGGNPQGGSPAIYSTSNPPWKACNDTSVPGEALCRNGVWLRAPFPDSDGHGLVYGTWAVTAPS